MSIENSMIILNVIAFVSWFILISFPRHLSALQAIPALIVPVLLSVLYIGIFSFFLLKTESSFTALLDTQTLLTNKLVLLAGLLHYQIFNLLVGKWISEEAYDMGMAQGYRTVILIVTSLFGPAGYLLFIFSRWKMNKPSIIV